MEATGRHSTRATQITSCIWAKKALLSVVCWTRMNQTFHPSEAKDLTCCNTRRRHHLLERTLSKPLTLSPGKQHADTRKKIISQVKQLTTMTYWIFLTSARKKKVMQMNLMTCKMKGHATTLIHHSVTSPISLGRELWKLGCHQTTHYSWIGYQ